MDLYEELERLDNERFHAKEAIEHLECVGDAEEVTEVVRDMLRAIQAEYDRVHESIEVMEDREQEELKREYLRSI